MRRKLRAGLLLLALLGLVPGPLAAAGEEVWAALAADGGILLLRHAQTVPGTGDPAGFRPDDCATQRNLNEAGREQARALGETLRRRGVAAGRVLSSPWCRTLETARLLRLGPVEPSPLLASTWNDEVQNPDRSDQLRALAAAWQGPGALILVTHGITMRGLIGRSAGQGGGYVLRARPGAAAALEIVGALP